MTETKNVGVLSGSMKQLGELISVVRGAGFTVGAFIDISQPLPKSFPEVDVWVVNIDLGDDSSQAIIEKLDEAGATIIFDDDHHQETAVRIAGDGEAAQPSAVKMRRERRLAEKVSNVLKQAHKPPVADDTTSARAKRVWVLGASTGGPEAVIDFLECIPANLPGVAFIYVQHMEDFGHENLIKVIGHHSPWPVHNGDHSHTLRERNVYVLSPTQQVSLSESGVMAPLGTPWTGYYKPSIDQVMAKVARAYGGKAGAIIFTGMGDDGAQSASLIHHRGGKVWVQSAETCAVDSMPQSVEKKGFAGLSGSPEELAIEFINFISTQSE